jgi:hypothetical protein
MQCTHPTLLSAGRQGRRHALSNVYRNSRPRVLALGLVIEGTCPDESFQPINSHSTHQSEWRDQTDLGRSSVEIYAAAGSSSGQDDDARQIIAAAGQAANASKCVASVEVVDKL